MNCMKERLYLANHETNQAFLQNRFRKLKPPLVHTRWRMFPNIHC